MIKKVFLPCLLACVLILGFSMPASAADDWHVCEIFPEKTLTLTFNDEFGTYEWYANDFSLFTDDFCELWVNGSLSTYTQVVVIVDGVSYLCSLYSETHLITAYYPAGTDVDTSTFYLEAGDDSIDDTADYSVLAFYPSFFADPTAETQTVTISAYVGTLPTTWSDDVVASVTGLFGAVGLWIVNSLAKLEGMFWSSERGLTLIGVLSAVVAGSRLILLLVRWIKNVVRLR